MPSTHKSIHAETHKCSQGDIHSLLCKSTWAYLHMQTHSLLHAPTRTYPHRPQPGRGNPPPAGSGCCLPGFVLRIRAFYLQILPGKDLPVDSLTSTRKLSSLWTLGPDLSSERRNLKSPEPTAGTNHGVSTLGSPLGNYACALSLS